MFTFQTTVFYGRPQDVPTVVVMMGDDALRKKIAPIDRCDASSILDRMEQVYVSFLTSASRHFIITDRSSKPSIPLLLKTLLITALSQRGMIIIYGWTI